MVAMFVFQSGPNEETLYRPFHMCFLPNFNQFEQMVLEKKNSCQYVRRDLTKFENSKIT
jgi:hypothetical protein